MKYTKLLTSEQPQESASSSVVMPFKRHFQNLKPEYQEIIRSDLLDQLMRDSKLREVPINPTEIEEARIRAFWRFEGEDQGYVEWWAGNTKRR